MDASDDGPRTFGRRRLPLKVIFSYIFDYVIIVALMVGFRFVDAIEPFHQPFSMRNYSLRYPFAVHERVPMKLLLILVVAVPGVIIAAYSLVLDGLFSHRHMPGVGLYSGHHKLRNRLWELNCGILGLLLAGASAFVITGALKNATGKPRPDFVSRCQPIDGSYDPNSFQLYNDTICSQTNHHLIKDGFRSFPSGHSSSSWAGLFYLSLYLAGKLHFLDHRGEVWKAFVVLIPTLGAALITVTRIEDARHHPFDVITGSMLGALCAYVAYHQYFPPLHETWRHGRPFPMRSWGTQPADPTEDVVEREVARDQGKEPLRSGRRIEMLDDEREGGSLDHGPSAYAGVSARGVSQRDVSPTASHDSRPRPYGLGPERQPREHV